MSPVHNGYHDGNVYSRGKLKGRRRQADPLDHSYYIQGDGDTRHFVDPRAAIADTTRWRSVCDVCAWAGPWHPGWPDGAKAADVDGFRHRNEALGAPEWGHCPECGARTPDNALCALHAQAYEDHLTDKDPWA
jgi:hypothetical protein